MSGRFVSAQSIVDQFKRAKKEILKDLSTAHVWYPILQTIGPALLQEAEKALDYSERMVKNWLENRMFSPDEKGTEKAEKVAKFFRDASIHLSHGRRINRDEARAYGVKIENLEDNQELQDFVMSAYHLITLAFEKSPATKIIESNHDRRWIKNWTPIR